MEPGLQDKLHRALTQEFLSQGITVTPAAPYTLTAVVTRFDMTGISEKSGITADYRILITADFRLVDSQGKTVVTKNVSSPFIASFSAPDDLAAVIALKENAEEKALRDLASEVAALLIYR